MKIIVRVAVIASAALVACADNPSEMPSTSEVQPAQHQEVDPQFPIEVAKLVAGSDSLAFYRSLGCESRIDQAA